MADTTNDVRQRLLHKLSQDRQKLVAAERIRDSLKTVYENCTAMMEDFPLNSDTIPATQLAPKVADAWLNWGTICSSKVHMIKALEHEISKLEEKE